MTDLVESRDVSPQSYSWKDAIIHVLTSAGEPMHYSDIADEIIELGLRSSYGATPANTVATNITTSIRNDGVRSPFVQVARAIYGLRVFLSDAEERSVGNEADTNADGSGVIGAYGILWERSKIGWRRSGAILGNKGTGTDAIDFGGQFGIYILYDRREPVYVGRCIDRKLSVRLYEHTQNRLQCRWDRFSWFGLKAIGSDGELEEIITESIDSDALIIALEAVMIEALEPRLNRKSGDFLKGKEFYQVTDPELENENTKSVLVKALSALET